MKEWSIFGVNFTPKFTKEDKNILKVNNKKEIFFDVFECKFNGEDIIVEQVGETDGLPIVRFETIKNKTKLVCEAILVEDNECGLIINEDNLEFIKNIETSPVKTLIQEEIEKTLPIPVNTVYEDKIRDVSKKIIKESEEKTRELYENNLQQYKDKKQKIADQAEKYLTEKSESIKRELNEQYIDFLSNNDENVRKLIKVNIADITSTIDENINDILSKIDRLSVSNKQELTKILSENIVSINNNLDNKIKDLNDQLDIILHDSNTKLNKLDEKTSRLLEKNIKHTDEIVKNITSKIEQVDEKIEDYKIDTFKHVVENKSEIENSLNNINSKFKRVDEKIEDYKIDTFKHVVEKVADNKTEIEASLKNTISKINEQVDIKRDEVEKILAAELSNINEKLNIFSEEEDKKYKQLLENLNNLNKGEVKEILSEKINDKQLNSLKLDISKQFQNEMMSIKRLIEMSSGGGSVAKQFANGGTMDGSLNVTQNILSGGTNLLDIFNTDTSIDLQDVTDNGNTTTNSISSSSTLYGNDVVTNTVEFNTDAGVIVEPGQLAWNAEDLTLDLGMDTNVTLQVGQEQVLRVKCKDPLGVFNGMPVYASDTTGGSDNIEISRFSGVSGGVDEIYFIGVATEDIPENGIGFVTTFGKVREVDGRAYGINNGVKDPADTSNWAFGNVLWVSPNIAGTLTTIKPPAPNRRIPIAMVLKAPNQQNITLMVRAEHGYNLDDIHNVKYDNIQNNDLLNYNSSLSAWENTSDININSVTSNEGSFTTLNALTANFTQTIVSTTSALSVINDGTGPALYVQQSGNEPVATFVDKEGGTVIIDDGGNVGIGTASPLNNLTISTSDNATLSLEDTNQTMPSYSSAGFSSTYNTNTTGTWATYTGAGGGVIFRGFNTASASTPPLVFEGVSGDNTPAYPAIAFGAKKHNGTTGTTSIGDSEQAFGFFNNGPSGTQLMTILGNGNVGIGTDSPDSLLHVDGASGSPSTANSLITLRDSTSNIGFQMGAESGRGWIRSVDVGNQFLQYGILSLGEDYVSLGDGNEPDQLYIDTTSGNVGIGTDSPQVELHLSGDGSIVASGLLSGTNPVMLVSDTNSNTNVGIMAAGNTAAQRPILRFDRARGTISSPSAVQNNDYIGDVLYGGYDGSAMQYAAGAFAFVDGTPSSGSIPMRLSFVTGSNSGTRQERLVIKNDGLIGIGTDTPSGTLDIESSGSDTPLIITKANENSVRERLMTATIASSNNNESFFINNGTIGNNNFAPVFGGYSESTTLWPLGFGGYVNTTADASDSSTYGLMDFAGFRTTNASDPLNGTLSAIQNRKIFTVRNHSNIYLQIEADGTTLINKDGDTGVVLGVGTDTPLTGDNNTNLLDVGGSTQVNSAVEPITTISTNLAGIAALQLQNTSTASGNTEMRFIAANDAGEYMAFTTPGTNATGSFGGVNKSAGVFWFYSPNSGSNRSMNIVNLSTGAGGDIGMGTNNDIDFRIHLSGGFSFGSTAVATDPGATNMLVEGDIESQTSITTTDDAYDSGWNADLTVPTKNAVYDKVEALESVMVIWAEEATSRGTSTATGGGFQWSFGNGDETPSGEGIVLPYDCEVIALSLNVEAGTGTGTVELEKNGTLTGKTVSADFSGTNKTYQVLGTPESFSAGDVLNFKSTATSGGNSARVAAFIKIKLNV